MFFSAFQWANAVRSSLRESTGENHSGKLHHMALSDCAFDNSGSGITHAEYMPLRTIWYRYENESIKHFGAMLKNNDQTGYRGYISPEVDQLAGELFRRPSSYMRAYLEEVNKGTKDPNLLHSHHNCGLFSMVRYWQAMTITHVKTDEFGSKLVKPRAVPDSVQPPTAPTTTPPSAENPKTPARQTTATAFGSVPDFQTPAAKTHAPARGRAGGPATADEAYANTAMLLLLQATGLEFANALPSMHWVPPRMALHLAVPAFSPDSQRFEKQVLLEACVDGYLCSEMTPGASGTNGPVRPMAICEAKAAVRSRHLTSIERQESAEMAAWICSHPGDEGLLQMSASNRKRRLMISQDRDEIYIIIGEYGPGYEAYIRNTRYRSGMATTEAKERKKPAPIQTKIANRAVDCLGSPAFLSQVQGPIAQSISGWKKDPNVVRSLAQATSGQEQDASKQGTHQRATRPRETDHDVFDASEFLIMHRFGPWRTSDSTNMEVLIYRVLALMLQLRPPPPLSPAESESSGGAGPSGGSGGGGPSGNHSRNQSPNQSRDSWRGRTSHDGLFGVRPGPSASPSAGRGGKRSAADAGNNQSRTSSQNRPGSSSGTAPQGTQGVPSAGGSGTLAMRPAPQTGASGGHSRNPSPGGGQSNNPSRGGGKSGTGPTTRSKAAKRNPQGEGRS